MKEKINVEEKMKKRFGKLKRIMTFVEGLLMVVPMIVAIILIVTALLVGISGKEDKLNIISDVTGVENIEELDTKEVLIDVLDLKDDLENDEDFQNASDALKNLMITSAIIVKVVAYILAIGIVDYLVKIFGEVEKQGTPFTENNIKWLKRVNIIALIMWLLHTEMISVGLIFVIVISAFRTVFEYGYKLQKEADETL